MKKSKRIVIAKNTLDILAKGAYTNKNGKLIGIAKAQKEAVNHTKLYKPGELRALIEEPLGSPNETDTIFVVNGLTTLDSVRAEFSEDPELLCLNFASARHPGGGFLKGSEAQEESIARASGLYKCLMKAEPYYIANRRTETCLYTDHIIYSPGVPVFKDKEGELMDEAVRTAIITAPAVNTGVVRRQEPENVDKIESVMARRMEMVLAICKKHGHQTLILGAWGCGVFGNDPEVIASMFKDLLIGKYKNQFKKVVFSVYAKEERFIEPFRRHFGS